MGFRVFRGPHGPFRSDLGEISTPFLPWLMDVNDESILATSHCGYGTVRTRLRALKNLSLHHPSHFPTLALHCEST